MIIHRDDKGGKEIGWFRLSLSADLRQAAWVEIEILGNSGGLGLGEPTTSIRVGEHVFLDAGSGLETLDLEKIRKIQRIYLSHAHADHTSALPLLVETLFECAGVERLEVYALPEVLSVLRAHLFNGQVWPDFESIPESGKGFLRLVPVEPGKPIVDPAGFQVLPLSTQHDVPSCGFAITFGSGQVFVFTGDTGYSESLVQTLNGLGPIEVLLAECSFPSREAEKAVRFGHLTPQAIEKLVSRLDVRPAEIWLGHLKPGPEREIREELQAYEFRVRPAGFHRTFSGRVES